MAKQNGTLQEGIFDCFARNFLPDYMMRTCLEQNLEAIFNLLKLIVVGQGRTGKSSMIRSLLGLDFIQDLASTVGFNKMDIDRKQVNKQYGLNSSKSIIFQEEI